MSFHLTLSTVPSDLESCEPRVFFLNILDWFKKTAISTSYSHDSHKYSWSPNLSEACNLRRKNDIRLSIGNGFKHGIHYMSAKRRLSWVIFPTIYLKIIRIVTGTVQHPHFITKSDRLVFLLIFQEHKFLYYAKIRFVKYWLDTFRIQKYMQYLLTPNSWNTIQLYLPNTKIFEIMIVITEINHLCNQPIHLHNW